MTDDPPLTPDRAASCDDACRAAFALVNAAAHETAGDPIPGAVEAACDLILDLDPGQLVDAATYSAYLAGGIIAAHLDHNTDEIAAWLSSAADSLAHRYLQSAQEPPQAPTGTDPDR